MPNTCQNELWSDQSDITTGRYALSQNHLKIRISGVPRPLLYPCIHKQRKFPLNYKHMQHSRTSLATPLCWPCSPAAIYPRLCLHCKCKKMSNLTEKLKENFKNWTVNGIRTLHFPPHKYKKWGKNAITSCAPSPNCTIPLPFWVLQPLHLPSAPPSCQQHSAQLVSAETVKHAVKLLVTHNQTDLKSRRESSKKHGD